jgi:anti-sigma28 factor (negative regulator of flagellin synthesis)
MKIKGGGSGPIRSDATRDERIPGQNKTDAGGSRARVDKVEISTAGKARAAGSAAAPNARAARLQDIRERILRGAYDTDEVVGEVARRILDRGDLQPFPASETQ